MSSIMKVSFGQAAKAAVLVVDDEIFFRRLFSEVLSEDDYWVETAASGSAALKRINEGGISVVVTDMVMPGLSGLDLLKRIRSLETPPDVIFATGHATLDTAIEALKNGARDYLIKPFNPDELRHLVRTCFEQQRLVSENSLLRSQLELFRKGQNLASLLEIDRLLPMAMKVLLAEATSQRGFVFMYEDGAIYRLNAVVGLEEADAMVVAQALVPRLPELIDMHFFDAAELTLKRPLTEAFQRLCVCPLYCEKTLRGSLVLFNPPGADFSSSSFDNILFLAEQAGLGFENAYRFQGARDLMYADDLTGLHNYRFQQIALDREISRSDRYGLNFSLIFIDLDHFKEVNDTYGHLTGSNTLVVVAEQLRQSVREVDSLFRYGGDEFTALLVETDAKGAAVVAERIRAAIESHVFTSDCGSPFRVTATVGYATYPENATDMQMIIELADRAMYDGKKERNVIRGAWEIAG